MEYMGNKDYWNDKFKSRNNQLLQPEASLVENIHYFKKGSVLDLACGDGRNTLFLLKNQFQVTGIDFSEIALNRLKRFAEENNFIIETKQIDLSNPCALKKIGIFNNIVVNHYRLGKEQIADIKNHISENGILFICGFGEKQITNSKIKKEDLINNSDFHQLESSFELMNYFEQKDERGYFVTYIFRKNR